MSTVAVIVDVNERAWTEISSRRSVRGSMLVWRGFRPPNATAIRSCDLAAMRNGCGPHIFHGPGTEFQRFGKSAIGANKGEFMSRQNKSRVLVEKIDDAIEQAEDLGLTFVAGILMMARLEAMQTDLMTCGGRADEERR